MKRLDLDLFFQMVLLALFVIMMWESRSYPSESSFYPRIVAGVTIILLLVSLVRHFRKKGEAKTDRESILRRRRFLQISLVVVLATVLGYVGGFIVSVLCYYVAYALFHEDRTRLIRTLGIGVVLTVLFYISFAWFMQVPLLRGWLVDF